MVATFDDSLRMVVPPAVVGDESTASAMKAQIDAVSGGFQTTLFDSLFRLAWYLERCDLGREEEQTIAFTLLALVHDRNTYLKAVLDLELGGDFEEDYRLADYRPFRGEHTGALLQLIEADHLTVHALTK